MAEIFDFYCTARFLGVALHVFFPDHQGELVLRKFNDKGKKKWSVAIILDSSRRPVRLFRTSVVHKYDVLDNPYHMMLKRER